MKSTIKNWFAAILFVTTMGGGMLAVATPQPALAACDGRLLTLPPWYRGLTKADCDLMSPTDVGGISNYIWTIALNIVEMILQIVGYISVAFIIFGGFKYMTSAGSPDGMVKARKTITNAIVGLLISIFSVAIVNLVAGAIKS
ncbi:MAG: hypothetical protein JWM07_20 [Candidatus Saccharibacteria bacterium]|nr:hypothetical protein [Candidatus Saccharibacteria bacterium]